MTVLWMNAGDPDTSDPPETDLGGVPRESGAAVDIGAYGFDQKIPVTSAKK
jgi:hypothetical protein